MPKFKKILPRLVLRIVFILFFIAETSDKMRICKLQYFCYCLSLQVGVNMLAAIHFTIAFIVLLALSFTPRPSNTKDDNPMSYLLVYVYLTIAIIAYSIAVVASFLEYKVMYRTSYFLILISFIYWVVLCGCAFFGDQHVKSLWVTDIADYKNALVVFYDMTFQYDTQLEKQCGFNWPSFLNRCGQSMWLISFKRTTYISGDCRAFVPQRMHLRGKRNHFVKNMTGGEPGPPNIDLNRQLTNPSFLGTGQPLGSDSVEFNTSSLISVSLDQLAPKNFSPRLYETISKEKGSKMLTMENNQSSSIISQNVSKTQDAGLNFESLSPRDTYQLFLGSVLKKSKLNDPFPLVDSETPTSVEVPRQKLNSSNLSVTADLNLNSMGIEKFLRNVQNFNSINQITPSSTKPHPLPDDSTNKLNFSNNTIRLKSNITFDRYYDTQNFGNFPLSSNISKFFVISPFEIPDKKPHNMVTEDPLLFYFTESDRLPQTIDPKTITLFVKEMTKPFSEVSSTPQNFGQELIKGSEKVLRDAEEINKSDRAELTEITPRIDPSLGRGVERLQKSVRRSPVGPLANDAVNEMNRGLRIPDYGGSGNNTYKKVRVPFRPSNRIFSTRTPRTPRYLSGEVYIEPSENTRISDISKAVPYNSERELQDQKIQGPSKTENLTKKSHKGSSRNGKEHNHQRKGNRLTTEISTVSLDDEEHSPEDEDAYYYDDGNGLPDKNGGPKPPIHLPPPSQPIQEKKVKGKKSPGQLEAGGVPLQNTNPWGYWPPNWVQKKADSFPPGFLPQNIIPEGLQPGIEGIKGTIKNILPSKPGSAKKQQSENNGNSESTGRGYCIHYADITLFYQVAALVLFFSNAALILYTVIVIGSHLDEMEKKTVFSTVVPGINPNGVPTTPVYTQPIPERIYQGPRLPSTGPNTLNQNGQLPYQNGQTPRQKSQSPYQNGQTPQENGQFPRM